jgi:arylsulfatase
MKLGVSILGIAFLAVSTSVAADNPKVIEQKFHSREQAIHLMDDWMRDPFITKGPDGYFYLSCTRLDNLPGGVQGLEIWRSKDLKSWANFGVPWTTEDSHWLAPFVEEAENRPDGKGFLLWAPEIWFLDGRWIATHTANIGKANLLQNRSIELKGPFEEPMGTEMGRRHDPSIFQDDDGSLWLLWACAKIQQLKPDMSGFIGDAYDIPPSNRKLGHEGCQIIKVGDKYVLFGTAWSTDKMRHGTYNLYYCTADRLTGPYGERRWVGRCLGHGTLFQDHADQWWCTAFINGRYVQPGDAVYDDPNPETAYTFNPKGLTIVPVDIGMEDEDVVIETRDPHYTKPGPDEVQAF